MLGVPTVLITVEPEESAQARPPRALCPRGFIAGHTLGRPGDEELKSLLGTPGATGVFGATAFCDIGARSNSACERVII